MLINTPSRYAVIKRAANGIIPVPILRDSVLTVIENWWVQVRLPDNKYSSILHVTLPDAYTWPGELPETAAPLPCYYGYGSGGNLIQDIPEISKYVTGADGALYVDCVWAGAHVILLIPLRVSHGWSNQKYVTISVNPNQYVHGFTGLPSEFGEQWLRTFTAKPSQCPVFKFDFGTSFSEVASALSDWINQMSAIATPANWKITESGEYKNLPTTREIISRVNQEIRFNLRFEEEGLVRSHNHRERVFNAYNQRKEYVTLSGDGYPKWVDQDLLFSAGRSKAYISALEDFPRMSDNMLQNITALLCPLASFAFETEATADVFNRLFKACGKRSVAKDHVWKIRLPLYDKFKEAWLSQRYEITTSVMDGDQAWRFFNHQAQVWLGQESEAVKCHGKITDDGVTFQCTFRMQEKAWTGLTKLFESSYKYGVEPNAYVMWDFIPFSFVLDWFVPVGDSLWAYTAASHYTPQYYDYLPTYGGEYSFCYSVAYNFNAFFGPCSVYCRWYETAPPNVETSYVLLRPERQVSNRTACMRFLDGICLFF